jgi:molybdopterin/thiamine biosynthesis adenylyltransferase
MQQWYERNGYYKQRFLREIEFVKQYRIDKPNSSIKCSFFGESKEFIVTYTLEYSGKTYGILCAYPFLYPKVRIKVIVYELNYKEGKIEVFDEGYHNSSGVLCLLLHYPNQWKEEYGIEYVIKRVNEWFETGQYDKSNNIPMNFNIDNEIFILPDPLPGNINQDYALFEYCNIREKICVITAILTSKENTIVENLPKSISTENAKTEKGIIIFTLKPFLNKQPTSFSDIKSYFNRFKHGVKGFLNFAKKNGINFPIPLIIISKNQNCEGQSFFILKSSEILEIRVCRFTSFRVYEDIFSRVKDKNDLEYLKKKKIGLVGLGAIGSVIAAELARSGIGEFILIDYDKLEIQNIGRHDLTLRDIDKYKVNGVKEKLLDINPMIECQDYSFDVLDDYSFNLYNLVSCDLVISTMDNQEAKYAIDSTLIPFGKKILFAGAYYNSVAGFVLVSDKKMGCFKCITQHMDNMADSGVIPDFSKMVPAETEYNCGLPTFPGGSINTHTVSLLTARIALDILLGKREINDDGYPYNLHLIGNEKIALGDKKFFQGFMDIKKFTLPGREGCEICDQEVVLSEEENNQYNTIMEKLNTDALHK